MKINKKQLQQLKERWGDWEVVHSLHDEFIIKRLRELDPEFMKDIDDKFKHATFWYA